MGEVGNTLSTFLRRLVRLGEVVVLVEDGVSRRLDGLGVRHVSAPNTIASVSGVAHEDTSFSARLQRSGVVLHDVRRGEGDTEMREVRYLVGEVLDGRDVTRVGRRRRSVHDIVGHAASKAPVSLVLVAVK